MRLAIVSRIFVLLRLVAVFVATRPDDVFLVDGGVEELLVTPSRTFRLEGDVADAVLLTENVFNLTVDTLHLAEWEVLAVEVGREDDSVFINHPGVDVVNILDTGNLLDILGDVVIVQVWG